MLHHITLSRYGIGVCVTAIGLWLYLKWTDQDLSEGQWILFILAILAWPLVLLAVPYRFLMWLWSAIRCPGTTGRLTAGKPRQPAAPR